MRWPFHRPHQQPSAAGSSGADLPTPVRSDSASAPRPARANWLDAEPLQRTIGGSPAVGGASTFVSDLGTRQPPPKVLQTLSHNVSPSAPSGLADLAVTVGVYRPAQADRTVIQADHRMRATHRPEDGAEFEPIGASTANLRRASDGLSQADVSVPGARVIEPSGSGHALRPVGGTAPAPAAGSNSAGAVPAPVRVLRAVDPPGGATPWTSRPDRSELPQRETRRLTPVAAETASLRTGPPVRESETPPPSTPAFVASGPGNDEPESAPIRASVQRSADLSRPPALGVASPKPFVTPHVATSPVPATPLPQAGSGTGGSNPSDSRDGGNEPVGAGRGRSEEVVQPLDESDGSSPSGASTPVGVPPAVSPSSTAGGPLSPPSATPVLGSPVAPLAPQPSVASRRTALDSVDAPDGGKGPDPVTPSRALPQDRPTRAGEPGGGVAGLLPAQRSPLGSPDPKDETEPRRVGLGVPSRDRPPGARPIGSPPERTTGLSGPDASTRRAPHRTDPTDPTDRTDQTGPTGPTGPSSRTGPAVQRSAEVGPARSLAPVPGPLAAGSDPHGRANGLPDEPGSVGPPPSPDTRTSDRSRSEIWHTPTRAPDDAGVLPAVHRGSTGRAGGLTPSSGPVIVSRVPLVGGRVLTAIAGRTPGTPMAASPARELADGGGPGVDRRPDARSPFSPTELAPDWEGKPEQWTSVQRSAATSDPLFKPAGRPSDGAGAPHSASRPAPVLVHRQPLGRMSADEEPAVSGVQGEAPSWTLPSAQRAATGEAAAAGDSPYGTMTATAGSAHGGEAGATGPDLDKLAGELYERIRGRLAGELLVDRERAGLLVDL